MGKWYGPSAMGLVHLFVRVKCAAFKTIDMLRSHASRNGKGEGAHCEMFSWDGREYNDSNARVNDVRVAETSY